MIGIEATLKIAQIQISMLRDFYDAGERHFTSDLNQLEDRAGTLTDDQWEQIANFVGQRDELEELRELKSHFSIIGLFTVFEIFLQHTLWQLRWAGAGVPGCIRKMLWPEMKRAFKEIGLPIPRPDADWKAIVGIKEARNCIAHSSGRIDDKKMVCKLKTDYGIPVIEEPWKPPKGEKLEPSSWRIRITDRYFWKSADLVECACKRIAKDCQDGLKKNRVKRIPPPHAGLGGD